MTNAIKTEIRGSVLEVTIDRPKANAIDASSAVCHFNCSVMNESPSWCVRHFQASFVHQILAVHRE